MKKTTLLAVQIALACNLAACSKKPDDAPAAAVPAAAIAAPSLADLQNPEAVNKAVAATLPKGDPATPLNAYRKVDSGHQVMFMYYALSNMPAPYEEIAQTYSDEYRRTNDSFKQRDILKALQPRIDQEILGARNGRYIVVDQQDSRLLQRYDFDKKAFAINDFSDDRYTFFNDNSQYTLATTNAADFAAFKVTDEAKAREIESYLSSYKPLRLETYAFAQDADPSKRRIKLQVMKVRLLDARGNVLAEM
ncbi:hypothetical protein ACSUZJ_02595 [Telluria sp. B2]